MKKYLITACLFVTGFIVFTSEIIEIPFYYDKADGHIYVYAEIGNRKGYFAFDTGSFQTIVLDKKENYKSFKLVSDKGTLIVKNLKISNFIYSSNTLILAGNKININYEFSVTEDPNLILSSPEIAGIIGTNIFKDKLFEISMSDSVIRIYDEKPDSYISSEPVSNEEFKKYHKIFIPIIINDKTYQALIDTGAPEAELSPKLCDGENGECLTVKVFSKTKHPFEKDYFLVKKNIELMGVKLENKIFKTHVHRNVDESLIGMNFLSGFDMLFDLRNSEKPLFYYKQRTPAEYINIFIDNTDNGSFAFFLNGKGSEVIISDIVENSPAWKAGLRPGTVITKFNSQPVFQYSINELKKLANTILRVTFIDKDGKEKTVKIKPKKML